MRKRSGASQSARNECVGDQVRRAVDEIRGEDVGVGYLPDDAIAYEDDGSFSVLLGPEVSGPSTLVNPPEATILNVRQIWSGVDR